MAGAGYKLFNTGDVLTAAQVNTYLQEQVVMVFANAAARTTALSGVLAEGMVTYLKDTDALEIYSGAAWVGYGSGDITGVTAGTGISGGGTSGTVTITNSMATEITAAGDIIVGTGSGTFDNLPIGTTGQILTADTTVSPYKVKWAAASSGALVLIKAPTTFTSVANTGTTFDSVFSSTYRSYCIVINAIAAATGSDDLRLQMLYSGTAATGQHTGSSIRFPFQSATVANDYATNQDYLQLSTTTSGNIDAPLTGVLWMNNAKSTTYTPQWVGQIWDGNESAIISFAGAQQTARQYTGFQLKSSSSNITGTVSVYGLAVS